MCVCYTDCCTAERRAALTATMYISRHTRTAGTLIHLPLFIRVEHSPLVQTRRPWVCNTHTHTHTHTHIQSKLVKHSANSEAGWVHFNSHLWYLGIHSSISQESSLVFGHSRTQQMNTLQWGTQFVPAENARRNRLLNKTVDHELKKKKIFQQTFGLSSLSFMFWLSVCLSKIHHSKNIT